MANVARFTRRLPASTSQCLKPRTPPAAARSFTSCAAPIRPARAVAKKHCQLRNFSKFAPASASIASQEAPNAQAYLNSGAIAGARDLVDVKKVLVIGSGGLSIGQAGEFDYSGEYPSFGWSRVEKYLTPFKAHRP